MIQFLRRMFPVISCTSTVQYVTMLAVVATAGILFSAVGASQRPVLAQELQARRCRSSDRQRFACKAGSLGP